MLHGGHSDILMHVTVILMHLTDWVHRHCHCVACVAAKHDDTQHDDTQQA